MLNSHTDSHLEQIVYDDLLYEEEINFKCDNLLISQCTALSIYYFVQCIHLYLIHFQLENYIHLLRFMWDC